MKLAWCLALVAPLMLCGCAATVTRGDASRVSVPTESSRRIVMNMSGPPRSSGSSDWEAFKGEWRSAFQRHTSAAGIAFEPQEGPAKPTAEPGTLLSVWVDDYRYLSAGVRYGFGVMTGNAYIEAKISFLDAASGALFGERRFNTSSSAWEGVFSAMTDKQVDAIAAEVVAEVRRGGGRPLAAAAAGDTPAPRAAPASLRPTAPAQPRGDSARDVERMNEARACSANPRPAMTAKGPGFESYSVACDNGDSLAVRCEYGTCRVLR